MRALEIRVRDEGGAWSDWVETARGRPGLRRRRRRGPGARRVPARGELHFVNVTGTAGGLADRLLNAARERDQLGVHLGRIEPRRRGARAEAEDRHPRGMGRDARRGRLPAARARRVRRRSAAAVIHHTVERERLHAARRRRGSCSGSAASTSTATAGTTSATTRSSTASASSTRGARAGWGSPCVGAQAQGFNAQTTAIASIGEHTSTKLSKKARGAIIKFLAWKMRAERGDARVRDDDR